MLRSFSLSLIALAAMAGAAMAEPRLSAAATRLAKSVEAHGCTVTSQNSKDVEKDAKLAKNESFGALSDLVASGALVQNKDGTYRLTIRSCKK